MASRIAGHTERRPRIYSISKVDVNDDDSIVAFVQTRWDTRDRHRGELEKQWFTCIAHYMGYHYHTLDAQGYFTLPRAPSWRVRLVCNRLLMIARKFVAKAMRQKPTWVVVPASSELEDLQVAKVSEKVLQYYWRLLNMDRSLVNFFTWMAVTGNAFFRVYWDPDRGPEMDLTQELGGWPELAEKLQGGTAVNLGDLALEVCSPFEIDVDPAAIYMDDITHLIHTRARNVDYLEDRYGAKGLVADTGDSQQMSRFYERRIRSMSGPHGTSTYNEEEDANTVLTHTLWVNPTKRNPKGFFAVVAGERVLAKGPLPNSFKRIPYVHAQEIPVPGRFWGTSAFEQCLSLQADYNRARSQLVEMRNLMAAPKWFVPKSSGVSSTSLTSKAGEIVEFVYPFKPEAWSPTIDAQIHLKTCDLAIRDIEDGAAYHDVTQGKLPPGGRSGRAIDLLQEQDEQMLAPAFLLAEKALAMIGSWALQILAENVTEDRVITIAGKDRQIEAMQFCGKSLFGPQAGKPGVNYFDVECQMGSQLPLAKSNRLLYAIDLVSAGILNPQTDRKKIFQILDFGTEVEDVTDEVLDRQLANQENIQMAQGVMVEANAFDNNLIHFETHERFQKQPEYQKLRVMDPMVDQRFEAHKALHAMALQGGMAPPTQPLDQASAVEGEPPGEPIPQEAAGPTPPEQPPMETI